MKTYQKTTQTTQKQTKAMSLVESITNVSIGLIVALTTQTIVFNIYDIETTTTDNIKIALIFTAVSIVRSYAVRRYFERIKR